MVVASQYGTAAVIVAVGIAAALVIAALGWAGMHLPDKPADEAEPSEPTADELRARRGG